MCKAPLRKNDLRTAKIIHWKKYYPISERASKNSLARKTSIPGTISALRIKKWDWSMRQLRNFRSRPKIPGGFWNAAACSDCVLWKKVCRSLQSNGISVVWILQDTAMRNTRVSASNWHRPMNR